MKKSTLKKKTKMIKIIPKKKKIIQAKASYPFKSQLEKMIFTIIKTKYPYEDIKINKKGLLRSNKNFELDLYFPKYNIGIEIQGPLHFLNESIILKDHEKKRLFLCEKNIKVIYIYTNTYENKKYSIKKCIDIINDEQKKRERK